MKLEHESAEELKRQIRDIVAKQVDLRQYKLFVFGSRVDGSSFERSDIDIGIEGPHRLNSTAKLDIEEDFENLRTLYKIDFVDFSRVSDDFREVALQHIEPIT